MWSRRPRPYTGCSADQKKKKKKKNMIYIVALGFKMSSVDQHGDPHFKIKYLSNICTYVINKSVMRLRDSKTWKNNI
jgi:hypothetical protein